jgi:hypothetical protein
MTVKLDPLLEEQVRERASQSGSTASDIIRAALQQYLALAPAGPARSPFALGADLFGQHAGPVDLAQDRKRNLAQLWADKHAQPSV